MMKQTRKKMGNNKTPSERQAPWWGLACCESYGKHIEKDRNDVSVFFDVFATAQGSRLKKDGMTRVEINNGPTAGNGGGASSL